MSPKRFHLICWIFFLFKDPCCHGNCQDNFASFQTLNSLTFATIFYKFRRNFGIRVFRHQLKVSKSLFIWKKYKEFSVNSSIAELLTSHRPLIDHIHIKNCNTCIFYILLYFLITIQLYNATGTELHGAKDNDPVAINLKTFKSESVQIRVGSN